ncbi:MAG: hypothetical protein H0X31_02760 [Nostocaceae cyanobacterium]|nr:hypothetical protein [Nostocaceae cyanobacterium]
MSAKIATLPNARYWCGVSNFPLIVRLQKSISCKRLSEEKQRDSAPRFSPLGYRSIRKLAT